MSSNWVLHLLELANALNMLVTPIFMLFMMVAITIGIVLMACGAFSSNKTKGDEP